NRLTGAVLSFNGGAFRSFASLLDSFKSCKPVQPADPLRTALMLYHELFKSIHGIAPGYRDMWEVIFEQGHVVWIPSGETYKLYGGRSLDLTFGKGKDFYLMEESQFRRTCKQIGLNLTSERFFLRLEKA